MIHEIDILSYVLYIFSDNINNINQNEHYYITIIIEAITIYSNGIHTYIIY